MSRGWYRGVCVDSVPRGLTTIEGEIDYVAQRVLFLVVVGADWLGVHRRDRAAGSTYLGFGLRGLTARFGKASASLQLVSI